MTVVLVGRIVSDRSYGMIFEAKVISGELATKGTELRVKTSSETMLGTPASGEQWLVFGRVEQTSWGQQIEASSLTRSVPDSQMLRQYIAEHVPGIGAERAERLWAAFGSDLPSRLTDDNIEALATIMAPDRPILGPRLASALVRQWRELNTEAVLVTWLQAIGVDDLRLVRRISRVLGDDARSRLEQNPWSLVSFLDWKRVDDIGLVLAKQADVKDAADLQQRLVGAVDAAMRSLIATGSTAALNADLTVALGRMLDVPKGHRRVVAAINAGLRNGAIIEGKGTEWRAPGCATMEDNVRQRLALMAAQAPAAIDDRVLTSLAEYEATAGKLHPEQLAAVLEILERRFACLQGGAGVGKTHVTKAICAAWEATGGTVLLAALAGKAALKLSRSTGRLARTLFRTLMEVEERSVIEDKLAIGELSREDQTKLTTRLATLVAITPDTLVLIDEASMVDLPTLHALLRHMPAGARLLLVGDDRQLPPISFGLIFHKLVHDAAVTSRLTVVHRQTDSSGIPAVANYLRNLTLPDLPVYGGLEDGVSIIEAEAPEDIAEQVLRVRHDFANEDALILAPTNEGPSGVRELNHRLHDSHINRHGGLELRNALGEIFSLGEPLLHRRNDYARGLFNGSMGVVRSVNPSAGTLSGRFDGDEVMFGPAELVDLSLGYAMTCHRAQGSQAARVIIALTRSKPLGPSWLYTAVTRAERQVVIVGSRHTLAIALERPWEAEQRRVGFAWPGISQPAA